MPIKGSAGSNIFFIAVIFSFYSCGRAVLSPEEYISWIGDKENGCIKTEIVGKVKYTVAYRPFEYNVAKAYMVSDSLGQATRKLMRHYEFVVKMEPVDEKTPVLVIDAIEKEDPFQRINYYLNEAPQYIELIEGKDTLSPSNYIYERYYNLSPDQSLVLGFDQKNPTNDKEVTLILEDKIFNTGKIAFNFSESTLKKIPLLQYDEK